MFQISANTVSLLPLQINRFSFVALASHTTKFISRTPVNSYQARQSITDCGNLALMASQTLLAGTLHPHPPQQLTSITIFSFEPLQPIAIKQLTFIEITGQSITADKINSTGYGFEGWQESGGQKVEMRVQWAGVGWRGLEGVQRVQCYWVIIFQQQTPIMFKKKHSEINIKLPLRPYSPLRNKTPPPLQPSPRNLSPMKNTPRNMNSRTPRKPTQNEPQLKNWTPRQFQNQCQPALQSFSTFNEGRYESNHRFPASKCQFRSELTNDLSYFSNCTNISKDNLQDPTLKSTKRLFTKCIAEMNSEKRKVCAERSNQVSNPGSVVQNSKQVISDSKPKNHTDTPPITSFKALKIQMIQSVLPPGRTNTVERKQLEFQNHMGAEYKTKEFLTQQTKKQQVIELINHSFSNAGVSRVVDEPEKDKRATILQARAKILESLYVEQESDYGDFDVIMRKIQILPQTRKMAEPEQVVKMSMESDRGSLNMDPFY